VCGRVQEPERGAHGGHPKGKVQLRADGLGHGAVPESVEGRVGVGVGGARATPGLNMAARGAGECEPPEGDLEVVGARKAPGSA
jgi:hypothetical protein